MPRLHWPLPDQTVRNPNFYLLWPLLGFTHTITKMTCSPTKILHHWAVLTTAITLVLRNCIECLGFESGPFKKNCSEACVSIHHVMVDQSTIQSKKCHQKDSEGCWINFNLDQLVGEDNYKAEILKQRGKLSYAYIYCMNHFFQCSFLWFYYLEKINRTKNRSGFKLFEQLWRWLCSCMLTFTGYLQRSKSMRKSFI